MLWSFYAFHESKLMNTELRKLVSSEKKLIRTQIIDDIMLY